MAGVDGAARLVPAAPPPAAAPLLLAAAFFPEAAGAGAEGTCRDARMGLGLIWRAAEESRPTNVLFITCSCTSCGETCVCE